MCIRDRDIGPTVIYYNETYFNEAGVTVISVAADDLEDFNNGEKDSRGKTKADYGITGEVKEKGYFELDGKKWFNNCRIEVCARFVEDAGSIGQAIWLMPEPAYQIYPGWPHGGEIDIMEHSYLNDYVQQTLHSHYIDIYQETPSGKAAYADYNKGTFNVYSADLTDEEIVFYTNDKETMRYANQHFPNESELVQLSLIHI